MNVKFGDLSIQYRAHQAEFDAAVHRVLESGQFIFGPELDAFEKEFAAYCGTRHAVGVASGTEAIYLALAALGIGPGDEVITVPNTAVPTISAISMANAKPVLVDVRPDDFNMDPQALKRRFTAKTKAILPVHLYGQTADMAPILEIAEKKGVPVIEDACQAHGARYGSKKAGSLGKMGCFSFYPSKNLGAFGDAGAITTDDDALYERLQMLRNYGQKIRYYHEIKGINSRLDAMQAALLRAKLKHLDAWNARRTRIAEYYEKHLADAIRTPREMAGRTHARHLYAILVQERDRLKKRLADKGIQTEIHYPVPVHLQKAYADLGQGPGSHPVAEQCALTELSLPMYPELTQEQVEAVVSAANESI
ncbi:DegT/DnrJ/EryC1/StrS family aminotransferase [Candidatus Micrarchaeota archaeon]|nr:DegT/DnrJ/EryC1/StrS family aminotransferase [Candidatus Micrarchaeota archaeon]